MKVVHYISDFTGAAGPMTAAVRMMIACTAKVADIHLVTCTPLNENYLKVLGEQYNIKVTVLAIPKKKNLLEHLAAKQSLKKVVKQISPDIVHVHGSWDSTGGALEAVARDKEIVTIVSPHRGLSQAFISIDFWKQKLPRLLAYQVFMVRNCTAVLALNEQEKEDLQNLSLKKRIEVLPPIPKTIEAAEPLRNALMEAYRKALDSTYCNKLTGKETEAVQKMVKAAIADDDVTMTPPEMTGLSMRRIFLHAYDEDVTEMMMQGARKMNLAMPQPLDVASLPRYKNKKAKQRGPVMELVPSKKISETVTGVERTAVEMLIKAQTPGLYGLTLRHYAELYHLFRHTDFNEDIVLAELKRLKATGYVRLLQNKLKEFFELKDGYLIICN